MPEHEVDRQERSGEPRPHAHRERLAPEPAVLPPGEEPERRQSVQTTKERARLRRDIGVAVEDPRERDPERACERRGYRPPRRQPSELECAPTHGPSFAEAWPVARELGASPPASGGRSGTRPRRARRLPRP